MSKFNWHARDSVSDNERDPNCPVVIQSSSASAASATTARCAVTVKLRESGSFVIAAGVLTEEDSEEFRAFVTEFHRTSNIRADAGDQLTVEIEFPCPPDHGWFWGVSVFQTADNVPTKDDPPAMNEDVEGVRQPAFLQTWKLDYISDHVQEGSGVVKFKETGTFVVVVGLILRRGESFPIVYAAGTGTVKQSHLAPSDGFDRRFCAIEQISGEVGDQLSFSTKFPIPPDPAPLTPSDQKVKRDYLMEVYGSESEIPFLDAPAYNAECFIASAAFQDDQHAVVNMLRRFRDNVLLRSAPTRRLVGVYYRRGPRIAEIVERRPILRFLSVAILSLVAAIYVVAEWSFHLVTLRRRSRV